MNETLVNSTAKDSESYTDIDLLKIVLILIIGTPIMVVGIITSLLALFMFFYDRITPKTTKHMIQFISVIDANFLLVALFYLNLKCAYLAFKDNLFLQKLWDIRKRFYFQILFVTNWLEITRNWTVVLVGIERYMVTCKPLQASRIWTVKRTHFALLIICVSCIILRSPELVEMYISLSYGLFHTDEEFKNMEIIKQMKFLRNCNEFLFLGALPIAILSFCSISIVRVLYSMRVLGVHPGINLEKMKQKTLTDENVVNRSYNRKLRSFNCLKTQTHHKGAISQVSMIGSSEERYINGYSIYTGPSLTIHLPQKRKNTAREEIKRRRLKVTRMIMIVLLMFVFLGLLSIIYWVLCFFADEHKYKIHEIQQIMSAIHWFSSTGYSTCNFFVYIMYMPKYRDIIRYLICVKSCKTVNNLKKRMFNISPDSDTRTNVCSSNAGYRSKKDNRFKCCRFECSCWLVRSFKQLSSYCCISCVIKKSQTTSRNTPMHIFVGQEARNTGTIPREPRHLHQYGSHNKYLLLGVSKRGNVASSWSTPDKEKTLFKTKSKLVSESTLGICTKSCSHCNSYNNEKRSDGFTEKNNFCQELSTILPWTNCSTQILHNQWHNESCKLHQIYHYCLHHGCCPCRTQSQVTFQNHVCNHHTIALLNQITPCHLSGTVERANSLIGKNSNNNAVAYDSPDT